MGKALAVGLVPKKKGSPIGEPSWILVPETGFELVTFALRMRCSTN